MTRDGKNSGIDEVGETERPPALSGAHVSATTEQINSLASAIADYLSTSPAFAKLDHVAVETMAHELAGELMFLAATQGAQAAHAQFNGKRGVRAKVGEAAMIGKLQALARQNGVDGLQQWRNGRGEREDLTTVGMELMQIAGIQGTVSQRTAVLARQQIRVP